MAEGADIFPDCPMNEAYCAGAIASKEAMATFEDHDDFVRTISDPLPVIQGMRTHLEEVRCLFVKTGQCEGASYLLKTLLNKPAE